MCIMYSLLHRRTDSEFRDYVGTFFFPNVTSAELNKVLELYPANVSQGSPFDTGTANAITPQFKRIAALLGDYVFQGARRFFLQHRSAKQHTWSFCMIIHLVLFVLN